MIAHKYFSINKIYLEIILLLIPFFRPDFISALYGETILDYIFICGRVCAFIVLCVKYISERKNPLKIGFILISVYEVIMMISVLINHVSFNSRVINIGNALGIYMLYMFYGEKRPKQLIKANFDFFSFMIICNAVLTLIFPHGLNNSPSDTGRVNFLGMDNVLSCFFVFAIIWAVIYMQQYPHKIRPYVIIGIVLLNEIYYFSGTGIIAIFSYVLLSVLLTKSRKIRILYNPINIFVVFFIAEVFLVFLQNVSQLGFLFQLLGKSSTFSDRFYYWRQGILQFASSPIIGLGSGTVDLWNNGYYSHNALLDVLMKGGVIGAILWSLMIVIPLQKLWINNSADRMSQLLCMALIPFLLIGLMEGLEDRIIFNAFVALAFSYKHIERLKNHVT